MKRFTRLKLMRLEECLSTAKHDKIQHLRDRLQSLEIQLLP
jgi:hypothetical protein